MYGLIKQAVSYFFVGGISAIVEWLMFAFFLNAMGLQYLLSTCLAFVFSTTTNWYLGRRWTFKGNEKYVDKKTQEVLLVFIVSAVGLFFNILLMYLFVDILNYNTDCQKIIGKIAATGIVFVWNFLVRKFFIYKNL